MLHTERANRDIDDARSTSNESPKGCADLEMVVPVDRPPLLPTDNRHACHRPAY